jgi:LPXTG-motif cell wall-anchored protein
MQKTVAIGATTLALLFGGTGVASATELSSPAPATTTLAQEAGQDDSGDNGLWGLAGLLGLLGLLGLKRRKTTDHAANRGGTITGNPRT